MLGEDEPRSTFFCAPLMKIRPVIVTSEFPPHHQETTSVELTYQEKTEYHYYSANKYDGPSLRFAKFAIPLNGSGKLKLWVEYNQTMARENYAQQKTGVQLWKGKAMSNVVMLKVE